MLPLCFSPKQRLYKTSLLLFTLETAYMLDTILRSVNIVARLRLKIIVARQEFITLKWVFAADAVTLVAPYTVSWIKIPILSNHMEEMKVTSACVDPIASLWVKWKEQMIRTLHILQYNAKQKDVIALPSIFPKLLLQIGFYSIHIVTKLLTKFFNSIKSSRQIFFSVHVLYLLHTKLYISKI